MCRCAREFDPHPGRKVSRFRTRGTVPSILQYRSHREFGFTLIEVLVVIALIALIGSMTAVAMSGGLQGIRLRAASKDIAAQLRFTRARAIAVGQPQRFVINPSAHFYVTPGGSNRRIPEQVGVEFYGARQASAQPGEGAIVFYPDGASTGGKIELSVRKVTRRITVAWLTGEVRMETPALSP